MASDPVVPSDLTEDPPVSGALAESGPGADSISGGAPGAAGRLLLLDGHSLAYRAFYALPVENFSTTTGQPTNAVYGFASMLANTVRDEAPTHLAVAFDVSRRTFRSERFADYKANRSATPDEFASQVSLITELLGAMRVPVVRAEGYEADDVIATLTTAAEHAGFEVLILTGDRDAFQLVTGGVTVLYPTKGVSELTRFTPAKVEERYGLTPTQYPDFAALRGDPSDNLPSIPGVGEKTAAKWIRDFGSFAELARRAGEVKGRAGEKLREHLEAVRLNRELTELVRDVALEVGPDDLARQPFDGPNVAAVLDTLEFRHQNFRERLLGIDPASAPTEDLSVFAGFDVAGESVAPDALSAWCARHLAGTERAGLAVDYEWSLGSGRATALAIASPDGAIGYLDPTGLTADDEKALTDWLADADRPKAVYAAKEVLRVFAEHGWTLDGVTSDPLVAAYLVAPGQRALDLADLSVRYLGRELRAESAENGQLAFDTDDDETATRAVMVRAQVVLELAAELDSVLEGVGGTKLLRDVELPLSAVLARMERTGIAADREYLTDLELGFAAAVKHATEEAHAAAGHPFNLGSPKQLQEILFGELNLPKTKRIKTGFTTDAEALATLATQTDNELPVILLRHRDASKLRTTVEGLIKTVAPDGRIHTTFNQVVAATGRLASTEPNLQNVPVRTDDGRRIRRAFIVGDGYESLLTADYSQIEMRIMAHLSQDAGLIAAFNTGEDLHTTVASRVFGVQADAVDAEMRRRIKAMSYGLAYGLSAFGLATQLGIASEEARALMEEYFHRFGGVRDYLQAVVEEARVTGYTETILGRRRYLPDLTSDNRQRREMAERMALNAPIQGSAADIIKVAMLRVDQALRATGLASRMLLQVHDELVFEVAPGEREQVEELVRRQMGEAYELLVPLDVSVGSGQTWDDAAH